MQAAKADLDRDGSIIAWPEFDEGDEDDMEAVLRELHLSELKY